MTVIKVVVNLHPNSVFQAITHICAYIPSFICLNPHDQSDHINYAGLYLIYKPVSMTYDDLFAKVK